MTAEEISKMVEDTAKALGEYFEAVQILVSNSDGDGTRSTFQGVGNYYARLGMARDFLERDTNDMLGCKIAEAMKEDED